MDEPWTADVHQVCGECGHVFPTAAALLADDAATAKEFGLTPAATAEQVVACPHCSHDL
ncbi:hypothetical protein [Streptosporangium sp. CA-115845]|uniref:hypothetical protein n=1 Tax=Streptosporangium sp. CA-115845 TaxID=3240071 RepID=UPI003D8B10D1